VRYGPIEARIEGGGGANVWIAVSLKDGKNREVRKVMAHLGLHVNRLIRTAYGPFQLGSLPSGSALEVPPNTLKDKLPAYFAQGSRLPSANRNGH
jgi:23S rRNA pseudouridine2605 synthase